MQNSAAAADSAAAVTFCQTLSALCDHLDLLDQPLLLDIFFLGTPQ